MDGFNQKKMDQLGEQLHTLRQQAMKLEPGLSRRQLVRMKEHHRFYPGLFISRGLSWKPYLDEIDLNYQQLRRLTQAGGALNQIGHLCEKILEQYSALSRAVSQPVKAPSAHKKTSKYEQMVRNVVSSNQQLYETLSEQKEFERRLQEMIESSEQQLAQASTAAQRDQMAQKVLQLRQRLGRCRKATWQVEERIRQAEKRN